MSNKFFDNMPYIVKNMLPLYPKKDIAFFASDLERYIYLEKPFFDIPFIHIGDEIPKDGLISKTISMRRTMIGEIPEKMYGKALKIIASPFFDDEQPERVIGTFGMALARDDAHSLRSISDTFTQSLQEICNAVESTAMAASSISQEEQQLSSEILTIKDSYAKINSILQYINEIAAQTKMLGLNAAIEAARAGDIGRGFGVVADEIRKLADVSKSTASQIMTITKEVDEKINIAITRVQESIKSTEEQAAATQEMNASIEELNSMMHEFKRIADEM